MKNLIFLSDSYKVTHWPQYPKGTQKVVSYMESRGGTFDSTVQFGIQGIVKKYLTGQVINQEFIDEAFSAFKAHFGNEKLFNKEGWEYILKQHGGRLPIKIKAAREGSIIGVSNVLMQVENLDPKVPWLTNYLESILLHAWYPITVATISREVKKSIVRYLKNTTNYSYSEILNIAAFMLHDFGFRGVSSVESAEIGGAAHLINFLGTDNLATIPYIKKYYNSSAMHGFSIPASEHSTMTSWLESGEVDAMRNMLEKYPTGLVACVSDSFDIVRAVSEYWGTELKDDIINREGRLVIRPDSGDPVTTIKKLLAILWEKFPGTVNKKGFKVLHDNVRLIQGDGVNYNSVNDILEMMLQEGYSVENIAFGMGGALLQKLDRDTQKFAFKCNMIEKNGEEIDVRKYPKEFNKDGEYISSFKTSKGGRLKLVQDGVNFRTVSKLDSAKEYARSNDKLIDIFKNGQLLNETTFEKIKGIAEISNNEFSKMS
jgi:nicotinamide phosphoribosyltransferase